MNTWTLYANPNGDLLLCGPTDPIQPLRFEILASGSRRDLAALAAELRAIRAGVR